MQRRARSEEHTSELQSQSNLVCRLLLEKKNYVAEQNFSQRCSALLSGIPRFKQRRNATEPDIAVHIPARGHDYNRVFIGSSDCLDELFLSRRKPECTVRAFTLARVIEADS